MAGGRSSGPLTGLETGQAWEATPGGQAVLLRGAILRSPAAHSSLILGG